MKFIDWFAGIGGFRRGMELAGHECVGFCEFDKFAVASYTSMHLITDEQREYLATLDLKTRQKEILKEEYRNGEWYADDIRRVFPGDIPRADCWCFGFPCQDISTSGKQIGLRGSRSSLFFRVMYLVGQLAEEERPTYLFIENVKNLLSVNGGWDFAQLLIELDKNGYDAEWTVLNSKDFGVPQNRERCFIVGHFRGRGSEEIFPIEGSDGTDSVHGIRQIAQIYGTVVEPNPMAGRIYDASGASPSLDTCQGGNRMPKVGVDVVGNTNPSGKGMNGNCYSADGLNPALTTNKGEGGRIVIPVGNDKGYIRIAQAPYENGRISSRTGVYDIESGVPATQATQAKDPYRVAIPVITPDHLNKSQNGRRFKEDGDESFTLTAHGINGVAVDVAGCDYTDKQGGNNTESGQG